jgi:hypothetical protein
MVWTERGAPLGSDLQYLSEQTDKSVLLGTYSESYCFLACTWLAPQIHMQESELLAVDIFGSWLCQGV